MADRFCSDCNEKLVSINRSEKCRKCKGKAEYEKRRQAAQKLLDENKAAGRVRLHSCISSLLDPIPRSCKCRKYVPLEEAREFIRIGRCVDFLTRTPNFFEREIVETSKQKNPPVSTLGSRIAIERQSRQFDEKDIARMKANVAEDQSWRKAERDSKIAVEHELAIESQNKLIVLIDEDAFEKAKARSWGRPGMFHTIDERTSIGVDVTPRCFILDITADSVTPTSIESEPTEEVEKEFHDAA